MSVGAPELSVLLPAFNEAESLPAVWTELGPVLDALEDLLAVRWMQTRHLRYDATEEP
ncbi:MAG: hypothetical protein ACREKQ_01745 [Candidatus Rokuibacteriota bacterium]